MPYKAGDYGVSNVLKVPVGGAIIYEEIDHPSHYRPDGIEAIAVIEDWDLNFHLGCVVKYLCRYQKKKIGTPLSDLLKAKWYLDRYTGWLQACLEPKAATPATKEDQAKEVKLANELHADLMKTLEVDRGELTADEYDFMMRTSREVEKITYVKLAAISNELTTLRIPEKENIADIVARAFRNAFRDELEKTKEQTDAV